jgi:hypothetical protein
LPGNFERGNMHLNLKSNSRTAPRHAAVLAEPERRTAMATSRRRASKHSAAEPLGRRVRVPRRLRRRRVQVQARCARTGEERRPDREGRRFRCRLGSLARAEPTIRRSSNPPGNQPAAQPDSGRSQTPSLMHRAARPPVCWTGSAPCRNPSEPAVIWRLADCRPYFTHRGRMTGASFALSECAFDQGRGVRDTAELRKRL